MVSKSLLLFHQIKNLQVQTCILKFITSFYNEDFNYTKKHDYSILMQLNENIAYSFIINQMICIIIIKIHFTSKIHWN